ncbi:MAG: acyltransferase [Muribaculaceae bacterium]|nr:acyltransferase [Muribaculaceae bacterium]
MKLNEIDGAKFLLISGVVLMHCNLLEDIGSEASVPTVAGFAIEYVSQWLSSACVPLFFLLSGFLFFRPDDKLTTELYIAKIKSRARSLLVPYLLWNTLFAIVFLLKTSGLDYESYGTAENPWRLLYGYWNLADGFPFDFPMWFIRNLIVISLLSPVAWWLGRHNIAFAAVLLLFIVSGHDLWGALYFIAGIWLRKHSGIYRLINRRITAIAGTAVWLGLGLLLMKYGATMPDQVNNSLWCVFIAAALCAFLAGGRMASFRLKPLVKSTFFIFAWHGLYCRKLRVLLISHLPLTNAGLLTAYWASFVILMLSSAAVYYAARRFAPRLTSVLTGGR